MVKVNMDLCDKCEYDCLTCVQGCPYKIQNRKEITQNIGYICARIVKTIINPIDFQFLVNNIDKFK